MLAALAASGQTPSAFARAKGFGPYSEQEARALLCQLLEKSKWFYSVETPTLERYQQRGSDSRSGRSDISVYATHLPESKRANIELKAHGKINVADFRKDFEKVLRENLDVLWFHTLERADSGTFPNVFRKMREAFALLRDEIDGRAHSIVFAFCVLERKELWLTTVTLAGTTADQLRRLDAVLDARHLRHPAGGGWLVYRPK